MKVKGYIREIEKECRLPQKQNSPICRIFLTEASKKLKTKRFVESLLEASKKLKTKRFVESLLEASKKLKTKRFVESLLEASKKLKIRKCEQSEHFRYINLYLIYC